MEIYKRDYALDFIKFIAAVMITNSHFIPLYKDINVGLATFGVHGNALFFFASGYLVMMGLQREDTNIADWYKNKVRRLWPAVLIWSLSTNVIWNSPCDWHRIIAISDYWFLRTIFVYYLLFYFVAKVLIRKNYIYSFGVIIVPLLITLYVALIMPKAEGSLFHTNWHYFCHFTVMIMGGLVCLNRDKLITNHKTKDWLLMFISFAAYFVVMHLGKGQNDWKYYLQLICLVPLHTFCYYLYKVCTQRWCSSMFENKVLGGFCLFVANLTLEIYVVQFHIITDIFNSVFPLNLLIVFLLIVVTAYFLRIVVNVFMQVMDKSRFDYKKMLKSN